MTPSEILGYFSFFAGLPGLRVAAYQPFVRVLGGAGRWVMRDEEGGGRGGVCMGWVGVLWGGGGGKC